MLIIRKDQIEHAATRLLTQAQVNPEAGPKAFEEYVKLRYPYLETAKKREKEKAIETLLKEIERGPLVVTPMGVAPVKSRIRHKIDRAELGDAREVSSRLSKKIGGIVPL